MVIGQETGIGHDPERHAAYVGSWVKSLKDDPLEIFRAAAAAEKIKEYILAFEKEQVMEQNSDQQRFPETFTLVSYRDINMGRLHCPKGDPTRVEFASAREAGAAFFNEPSDNEPTVIHAQENPGAPGGRFSRVLAWPRPELYGDRKVFEKMLPDVSDKVYGGVNAEFFDGYLEAKKKVLGDYPGQEPKHAPSFEQRLYDDLKKPAPFTINDEPLLHFLTAREAVAAAEAKGLTRIQYHITNEVHEDFFSRGISGKDWRGADGTPLMAIQEMADQHQFSEIAARSEARSANKVSGRTVDMKCAKADFRSMMQIQNQNERAAANALITRSMQASSDYKDGIHEALIQHADSRKAVHSRLNVSPARQAALREATGASLGRVQGLRPPVKSNHCEPELSR